MKILINMFLKKKYCFHIKRNVIVKSLPKTTLPHLPSGLLTIFSFFACSLYLFFSYSTFFHYFYRLSFLLHNTFETNIFFVHFRVLYGWPFHIVLLEYPTERPLSKQAHRAKHGQNYRQEMLMYKTIQ